MKLLFGVFLVLLAAGIVYLVWTQRLDDVAKTLVTPDNSSKPSGNQSRRVV